ncbi:MAG: hypothetical protein IJP82_04850 [Bacteroidaceae bacterium]|nr:hypothetical protein [Bacteroidaceae bacterium]
MKRLSLFLLLATIATTSTMAQDADSLTTQQDSPSQAASNIKITEEHPGGWNFDVLFSPKKSSKHWNPRMIFNFSLGFIGGVNQAEGVHLNMGQSIELELGNIISGQTPVGRNGIVLIGLGIGWRNYRMTNHQMFAKHDDGSIAIEPYPEGADSEFSRIHTFGFILPLKYYHKVGHRHGRNTYFAVGPELYYTPHACLKTRYKTEEGKQILKDNHLHFNKVTVGVGAEFIVQGLGVYYKYNPFNVLDTDYGPKFSTMTVGLKVAL